jgi:GTP-binding protein Era
MVETATETLGAADVVCLIVDASVPFGGGDQHLLELLRGVRAPRIVVLNKIDVVKKTALLPLMARYADSRLFDEIIPLSARDGDGVEILARELWSRLPEGEPLFDADLVTTHPERFLAAERIREQVLHHTRDELPFATAVLIDSWEDDLERGITRILATILVEKEGQRAIVIGREGSLIKAISTAARVDLEEFLGRQVFLRATVKCEPKWRESRGIIDMLERESMAADFTVEDGDESDEMVDEDDELAAGDGGDVAEEESDGDEDHEVDDEDAEKA